MALRVAAPRLFSPLRRGVFISPRTYSAKSTTTAPIASSSPAIQQAKEKAAPKVGKLKELAQKYGAAGVLVYLGIGAVDLSIAFGAIQVAGLDQVKRLERSVLDSVNGIKHRVLGSSPPLTPADEENEYQQRLAKESEEDDAGEPSLMSVFLLAYGIHKTLFLPVRLTITAAITPAFVRKLHTWGWTKYAPRLFGSSVTSNVK